MPLEPRTTLGSHELLSPIWASGMGEVYRDQNEGHAQQPEIISPITHLLDDPRGGRTRTPETGQEWLPCRTDFLTYHRPRSTLERWRKRVAAMSD